MHSGHSASGKGDGRRVPGVSAADQPRRRVSHVIPDRVPPEEPRHALLRVRVAPRPRSGGVVMCNAFPWAERARCPRVAGRSVVDW
jgi:hypothetical protein